MPSTNMAKGGYVGASITEKNLYFIVPTMVSQNVVCNLLLWKSSPYF